MMKPEILFRCDLCSEEVKVPINELKKEPVCPIHNQPMSTVGDIEELNEAMGDAMDAMARLAAMAMRNYSTASRMRKE